MQQSIKKSLFKKKGVTAAHFVNKISLINNFIDKIQTTNDYLNFKSA